jgi:hypothetical protein
VNIRFMYREDRQDGLMEECSLIADYIYKTKQVGGGNERSGWSGCAYKPFRARRHARRGQERERDGYSIGRDVRGAGVGSGAAPRGWRSARKAKAARAHTPASFFIHWVFLYAKIKFMKLPYGAVLPPL